MKAVITVYEKGNTNYLDKQSFIIEDEADLIQKSEDISEYLMEQLHSMEDEL